MQPTEPYKAQKPAVRVVKEEKVDFNDLEILSTSNPCWIEAGLSQGIIAVLSEKGISSFTPVQAEAFEPVFSGCNVMGRSCTGTGKTLAFGLPVIIQLQDIHLADGTCHFEKNLRKRGKFPSMIVLCPMHELARQMQEKLQTVSKVHRKFPSVFHGGVSYKPQARDLQNGIDILVRT